MKRTLAATAIVLVSLGLTSAVEAAEQSSPPTTIDVGTSTVERTVTTIDVDTVDTDDDDDSDKTGLWGLLGLLGLAGLAGLRKPKRDDYVTTSGIRADTTPRGSSTPDSRP